MGLDFDSDYGQNKIPLQLAADAARGSRLGFVVSKHHGEAKGSPGGRGGGGGGGGGEPGGTGLSRRTANRPNRLVSRCVNSQLAGKTSSPGLGLGFRLEG